MSKRTGTRASKRKAATAQAAAAEIPGISRVELSVGDATLEWTPTDFRGVIGRLLTD